MLLNMFNLVIFIFIIIVIGSRRNMWGTFDWAVKVGPAFIFLALLH